MCIYTYLYIHTFLLLRFFKVFLCRSLVMGTYTHVCIRIYVYIHIYTYTIYFHFFTINLCRSLVKCIGSLLTRVRRSLWLVSFVCRFARVYVFFDILHFFDICASLILSSIHHRSLSARPSLLYVSFIGLFC